MFFDYKPFQRL